MLFYRLSLKPSNPYFVIKNMLEHFSLTLHVSMHVSSLHTCVCTSLCMCEILVHTCVCDRRIIGKGLGKQIHFLWVEKSHGVTVSLRRCSCNPALLGPRLNPTSPLCFPPPVKLIVHLLGSHSSLCSLERDNWIPLLWPQPHWWMALMGFYCFIVMEYAKIRFSNFFSSWRPLQQNLFTPKTVVGLSVKKKKWV